MSKVEVIPKLKAKQTYLMMNLGGSQSNEFRTSHDHSKDRRRIEYPGEFSLIRQVGMTCTAQESTHFTRESLVSLSQRSNASKRFTDSHTASTRMAAGCSRGASLGTKRHEPQPQMNEKLGWRRPSGVNEEEKSAAPVGGSIAAKAPANRHHQWCE